MLNFSGFFDDTHVDVTPSKQARTHYENSHPSNKLLFEDTYRPVIRLEDIPEDVQQELCRRVKQELWVIVQQEIEKIRVETAKQIERIRMEMLAQHNSDLEQRITEQVEHILARRQNHVESTSASDFIQDNLNTEFDAHDFAKQLIQQAKMGKIPDPKLVTQPIQPVQSIQKQPLQQLQPETTYTPKQFATYEDYPQEQYYNQQPVSQQQCQQVYNYPIYQQYDEEENVEPEQEKPKQVSKPKVRFQKEPSPENSNKENEVISGNRYQEVINQPVKKTIVKKGKEDDVSKMEGRIEKWKREEQEYAEQFHQQQRILEEYWAMGKATLGIIISRVRSLLDFIYNLWTTLEMSYQQRHAFTSKYVLQPIVDSELNLTVENLRVVEDNLHKEASRLQPISSTNMKERIMVVRREEIKKQLEDLRIEMEQSKSKISAQYRKLATESSKLKQELKQLSKQLTTTLQQLERTSGEFTYRGFRYLDILSYEKLRHEQEEYENQKRDIQKKALRAR